MVNLYSKPEYFKQFNNENTLSNEEILANKDKILYVAMCRGQQYINYKYPTFSTEEQEEALQALAVDVSKCIMQYVEENKECALWAFIMKTVKEKTKKYFNKYGDTHGASNDTIRTARKVIRYQETYGLSVEETMAYFGIKRKSTYYGYLRLYESHTSLDMEDEAKRALYEKLDAEKLPDTYKHKVDKIESIKDTDILEGFSCEEVNIIKLYKMVMADEYRKRAWKRETANEYKKYGIPASRTAKVIKKYNEAMAEKMKKTKQTKGQ